MRSHFPAVIALAIAGINASNAALPDRSRPERAAITPPAFRPGTVLQEERVIHADLGSFKVISSKQPQDALARFVQRLNLTRRIQGTGSEDVAVDDHAEDALAYQRAPAPAPNDSPSVLARQRLRARLRAGRWTFELQNAKPTPAQQRALIDLGIATDLIEGALFSIGSGTRAVGESRQTPFTPPRGKAADVVVPLDSKCTLEAIEERQGEPHARLAISGKVRIERPTYNGTLLLTFKGTVVRRLKDMLDAETKLSGDFSFTGPVDAGGGAEGTLKLDLPFTLTRTLRIVPR